MNVGVDHLHQSEIKTVTGSAITYPMIGDPDLRLTKLYDMLPGDAGDTSQGRTAMDNQTVQTVQTVFLIGPG